MEFPEQKRGCQRRNGCCVKKCNARKKNLSTKIKRQKNASKNLKIKFYKKNDKEIHINDRIVFFFN